MESPEDTGDNREKRARMFGPDRFAPRLHDVSFETLESAGIRGLIVDLDNTLLGFRETQLRDESEAHTPTSATPRIPSAIVIAVRR